MLKQKDRDMTLQELKQLSDEHPYYCSSYSYFKLDFETEYSTWSDFINEMADSDHDMNLVFRWNVSQNDDGSYYAQIFLVHQRKGRFVPFNINLIKEDDAESFYNFIKSRQETINRLWNI